MKSIKGISDKGELKGEDQQKVGNKHNEEESLSRQFVSVELQDKFEPLHGFCFTGILGDLSKLPPSAENRRHKTFGGNFSTNKCINLNV